MTGAWPSQTDVAQAVGVTRARISQLVGRARQRWAKDPAITRLRVDVADLLDVNGGVMTVAELAQALVAKRGSVQEEPHRTRFALAVARAALETERAAAAPRFQERRSGETVLVAVREDAADYAMNLGRKADSLGRNRPPCCAGARSRRIAGHRRTFRCARASSYAVGQPRSGGVSRSRRFKPPRTVPPGHGRHQGGPACVGRAGLRRPTHACTDPGARCRSVSRKREVTVAPRARRDSRLMLVGTSNGNHILPVG